LKAGTSVLFTGTPCQIAGLTAFLGTEFENLLTIDLACHGVPSPKIWSMYLEYLKDNYKSSITQISFRNKKDGWSKSSMKIDFENGKTYIENVYKETYFIGFGKGIYNRECCFKCNFKLKNTKADITLADFWGIEKLQGIDASDNKGVSLLVVNTALGSAALSQIANNITIQERTFDEAVKGNPRLLTSCNMPVSRVEFFNAVKKGASFQKLRQKHMNNYSLTYKIKVAAKSIVSPKVIETLNKLRSR
jgi:coenzyme F420-reducing hydrogenase beta subunit